MNNNRKGNGHHLTLSDRTYLEQELNQNSTFRSIADSLCKDPSTISKEVRLHCHKSHSQTPRCKDCKLYETCKMYEICETSGCKQYCWNCSYNRYATQCSKFDPFKCPKLSKHPMFVMVVRKNRPAIMSKNTITLYVHIRSMKLLLANQEKAST